MGDSSAVVKKLLLREIVEFSVHAKKSLLSAMVVVGDHDAWPRMLLRCVMLRSFTSAFDRSVTVSQLVVKWERHTHKWCASNGRNETSMLGSSGIFFVRNRVGAILNASMSMFLCRMCV